MKTSLFTIVFTHPVNIWVTGDSLSEALGKAIGEMIKRYAEGHGISLSRASTRVSGQSTTHEVVQKRPIPMTVKRLEETIDALLEDWPDEVRPVSNSNAEGAQ